MRARTLTITLTGHSFARTELGIQLLDRDESVAEIFRTKWFAKGKSITLRDLSCPDVQLLQDGLSRSQRRWQDDPQVCATILRWQTEVRQALAAFLMSHPTP